MSHGSYKGNHVLLGLLALGALIAAAARPERGFERPPAQTQQALAIDEADAFSFASVLGTTASFPLTDAVEYQAEQDRLDASLATLAELAGGDWTITDWAMTDGSAPRIGTIDVPDEIVWMIEDARCELSLLSSGWQSGAIAGDTLARTIAATDRLEHALWFVSVYAAAGAEERIAHAEAFASLGLSAFEDVALRGTAVGNGLAQTRGVASFMEPAFVATRRSLSVARGELAARASFDVRPILARAARTPRAVAINSLATAGDVFVAASIARVRLSELATTLHAMAGDRLAVLNTRTSDAMRTALARLDRPNRVAQSWLVLAALSIRDEALVREEFIDDDEPAGVPVRTMATTRRTPTIDREMPRFESPMFPHEPAEEFFDAMPHQD